MQILIGYQPGYIYPGTHQGWKINKNQFWYIALVLKSLKNHLSNQLVLCWFYHENWRFFYVFWNNQDQWLSDSDCFQQTRINISLILKHYYKMWVQFVGPHSLDDWIHCFLSSPYSRQLVNSLKIQWNHLAFRDTFCCSEDFKELEPMVLWFEICNEPELLEPHIIGKNIMVMSSLNQIKVSESKFNIFWVKY
jgi:hypothetical protein